MIGKQKLLNSTDPAAALQSCYIHMDVQYVQIQHY